MQPTQPGFFARNFGSAAVKIATMRSPTEKRIDLANTRLGSLIEDLSKKTFESLAKDKDSLFLKSGGPQIETALKELTEHVFITFATEGIENPENLSEDELADHFITAIIKKAITNFPAKPDRPTKEHFIKIANDLLNAAFPDGVNDSKLPLLVRKLLSKDAWGHGIVSWFAKGKLGIDQELTWEGLSALFAEHLKSIYDSIENTKECHIAEEKDPGANEFIEKCIAKLDLKTKGISNLTFQIASLNDSSNQFVNSFLSRLLRGEIRREEDKELLTNARSWLIDSIKSSLRAIYTNIFAPVPGQTDVSRRCEFAERITTLASKHAPEMAKELRTIDSLSPSDIEALKASWLLDPAKADFRPSLTAAQPDEIKDLMKRISASIALKEILQHEMRPEQLKKLLPPFLSAEDALGLLYWHLAPYVIEVTAQLDEVENASKAAQKRLQDVESWITLALEKGRELLESKAKANTLQLTGYGFLDRLICHVLNRTNVPESFEAKNYIDNQIKNISCLILATAIPGSENITESQLANLMNSILKEGQKKVLELITMNVSDPEAETQFILQASKTILEKVLNQELFEKLLPPSLRNGKLWDELALLLANYFKELYLETKSIARKPALSIKEPALCSLVTSLEQMILKKLETPLEAQNGSKDQLFTYFIRGEGFIDLVKLALPPLLETFVAYHFNPKDGKTSEQLASALFVQVAAVADAGFDRVDAYESVENKPGWLYDAGFREEHFKAYKQKHNIPESAPLPVREFLLNDVAEKCVAALLPEPLIKEFIQSDLWSSYLQKLLVHISYGYIKDAYDYSHAMRQLVTTDDKTTDELLKGLQSYLGKQLETLLAASQPQEKSWVDWLKSVSRLVFSPENDTLLHKITPHIYFRAMGFIFSNANSVPGAQSDNKTDNLLILFAPIAKEAQELFLALNSKKSDGDKRLELGISEADIQSYVRTTGNYGYTQSSLAYWCAAKKAINRLFTDEQWKAFIPEVLQSILTKETAASFLQTAYEMVHKTQLVLQDREEKGLQLVRNEAGLETFMRDYFATNIIELLETLGNGPEPLNRTLPTLIDTFLKQCCLDKKTAVAPIRDALIDRLVFTSAGKILSDKASVLEQAKRLVKSYNQGHKSGDNLPAATLLINTLLPEEVLSTPLAKIIVSDMVKSEIAGLIGEIQESQEKFLKSGKEAKQYLDSLEGMPPFLTDIITSLEETIDDYTKPGAKKIVDNFPDYINNLLKEAFGDAELSPIIKTAAKNMIYIILQDALTPSVGQTVELKILDIAAALASSYNPQDMKATSAAWLKVLVPENRLKGLLPPFLQKTVTYEKLVKWFFEPYVKQIEEQLKKTKEEIEKPDNYNASRLNDWLTKFLLDHTSPFATKRGLFGQEGVVREMERTILMTLDPEKDQELNGPAGAYLKASVRQITEALEAQGILDPHFLSEALAFSLDGPMTAPADFTARAKETLLAKVFPKGKESLLVPDVAKDLVWKKISDAVEKLISDLQDPHRRMLRIIDLLIPFTSKDDKLVGQRQQVIEDMRLELEAGKVDPHFETKTEAMFKRYMVDAAVAQADLSIQETNLWAPLKWIARQIVKALAYLAMRFSLRNRIYSFIKDSTNNDKIRNVIWSFLNFTPPAQARPGPVVQDALKGKVKTTLSNQKLAPWILQGFLASKFTDYMDNKNLVDILT